MNNPETEKLIKLAAKYDDEDLFGDNILKDSMTSQEVGIAAVELARYWLDGEAP